MIAAGRSDMEAALCFAQEHNKTLQQDLLMLLDSADFGAVRWQGSQWLAMVDSQFEVHLLSLKRQPMAWSRAQIVLLLFCMGSVAGFPQGGSAVLTLSDLSLYGHSPSWPGVAKTSMFTECLFCAGCACIKVSRFSGTERRFEGQMGA